MSIKTRIILTFTILTAILVLLMARVSYFSVREIYLNQLAEQTNLLVRLASNGLDNKYLRFLNAGSGWNLASSYYAENLQAQAEIMQLNNMFIFDSDFKIIAQSAAGRPAGNSDSRLLLHRAEILSLKINRSTTSLPFKGTDGQWYLWGFYRMEDNHWLGIQESAARLAKVESLSQVFWGIGLFGVVLTILCGGLLARNIARPIDRLVEFSDLLGKGEFTTPVPEKVKGELAILANALDKMRDGLARHHQEKEAILAQIAHEIRNPLGGIELLAGLVKEDLNGQKSGEYVEKILDEIAGLKSLITAYLNFSRPAAPTPERVNVGEIVGEVQDIFAKRLEDRQITISGNGAGTDVNFDHSHLRQVLINLVSNSVEMLGGDGTIHIAANRNGQFADVLVSDNGPGIPDDNLSNIFEPFYTTRPEGTGLGLAICKKLCLENNAAISVENNVLSGCTFRISCPLPIEEKGDS